MIGECFNTLNMQFFTDDCKLTLRELLPYLDKITAIGGTKLAGWLAKDVQWTGIKYRPGDESDRVLELLHQWLEGEEIKDIPHTVEFFTDMLRSCGEKDLAHRIQFKRSNIYDPCELNSWLHFSCDLILCDYIVGKNTVTTHIDNTDVLVCKV